MSPSSSGANATPSTIRVLIPKEVGPAGAEDRNLFEVRRRAMTKRVTVNAVATGIGDPNSAPSRFLEQQSQHVRDDAAHERDPRSIPRLTSWLFSQLHQDEEAPE